MSTSVTVEKIDDHYDVNLKIPVKLYQDLKAIQGTSLEQILGELLGVEIVDRIQEKYEQ